MKTDAVYVLPTFFMSGLAETEIFILVTFRLCHTAEKCCKLTVRVGNPDGEKGARHPRIGRKAV